MDLYQYTYDLVKQIPARKISSYGAVARALGDVRASRAVGRMMNQNPDPDKMPCFKIVQSDGHIGGFGRGIKDKIERLNQDGIDIDENLIKDFDHVFFDEYQTDFPLKACRKEQMMLAKQVCIEDGFALDEIGYIAGFDVAYVFDDDWKKSCGACVIMDYQTGELIEQKTVFLESRFPYIPTYLAFREKPFIEHLINDISHQPSVLLIDGNGILHPYQFGIASHIGVTLDMPTIGVAKSRLCGKESTDHFVVYDNQVLGYAFYAHQRVKKPVYISPGHKVSLETSIEVVKNISPYKQPEPLRKAHQLATQSLSKYQ